MIFSGINLPHAALHATTRNHFSKVVFAILQEPSVTIAL